MNATCVVCGCAFTPRPGILHAACPQHALSNAALAERREQPRYTATCRVCGTTHVTHQPSAFVTCCGRRLVAPAPGYEDEPEVRP